MTGANSDRRIKILALVGSGLYPQRDNLIKELV